MPHVYSAFFLVDFKFVLLGIAGRMELTGSSDQGILKKFFLVPKSELLTARFTALFSRALLPCGSGPLLVLLFSILLPSGKGFVCLFVVLFCFQWKEPECAEHGSLSESTP